MRERKGGNGPGSRDGELLTMVHNSNADNSQGWPKPEPRVENSI